jgi:2-methylaconitate cis-trans-isomerase PrpF
MLKAHKAIQVSGSLCTGAAARSPGSIVSEVLRAAARTRATINIGHPSGTLPVAWSAGDRRHRDERNADVGHRHHHADHRAFGDA